MADRRVCAFFRRKIRGDLPAEIGRVRLHHRLRLHRGGNAQNGAHYA